ncbi:hypothetical protein [Comamonas sp. UBA7528]|uniref:hypothetical protein n=1 Tax=Comamonas sp. UBA7528 TaxID=1946391 RepID=UPI0025BC4DD3|nr:hypothetical protein [Comamonas sp. UBA7528]
MSTHSFQLPFFTIGDLDGLSGDDTTRTAHIDIPTDCLPVAATLRSARQWLVEHHPAVDMECAADLTLRGFFSFQGPQGQEGLNVDSAQLVAIDEGFVVRASLDNGVCVETDVLSLDGLV